MADYVTPLEKKYFNFDMMSKYEPLRDAMVQMEETKGEDDDVMAKFEEAWCNFMDFSWKSQWDGKQYDIVIYGAGGYNGYLVMEYMKRNTFKKGSSTTIAIAGRSSTKVAEMCERVFAGTEYEDTPILIADLDDAVSCIDLAKSAKVVVNCAGPYMLTEGEVLIDACIWCKTDYVDLSAEIPWSMKAKELHKYALEAGVMVVPGCAGNAYSDLGMYLAATKLRSDSGEATRSAVCYYQGGGTPAGIAGETLRTRAAVAGVDRATTAAAADPFCLGGFIPEVDRNGIKAVNIQLGTGILTTMPRQEDLDFNMHKLSEDKKNGVWRAPWINADLDARVVRRSNMLMADLNNQPYGVALNFTEFAMLPTEDIAQAKAAVREAKDEGADPYGNYGMKHEAEIERMRSDDKQFDEGEGPEADTFGDSWSAYFVHAETATGSEAKTCFVGADGYFETARMGVEMALTVLNSRSDLPKGGVLTPAVAGNTALIERLKDSGVKLKNGGWMESRDLSAPSING